MSHKKLLRIKIFLLKTKWKQEKDTNCAVCVKILSTRALKSNHVLSTVSRVVDPLYQFANILMLSNLLQDWVHKSGGRRGNQLGFGSLYCAEYDKEFRKCGLGDSHDPWRLSVAASCGFCFAGFDCLVGVQMEASPNEDYIRLGERSLHNYPCQLMMPITKGLSNITLVLPNVSSSIELETIRVGQCTHCSYMSVEKSQFLCTVIYITFFIAL